MTGFGDWEPADAFDVAPLDVDAVTRIFGRILRRLADDGEVGHTLIRRAVAELVARLQLEGTA